MRTLLINRLLYCAYTGYNKRRCLLAAMLAANSVPATVEALLLPNKLAAPPAYAFPAVQKAAANKTDC